MLEAQTIKKLTSEAVLKTVSSNDLVGFSGSLETLFGLSEVTISLYQGEPHFVFPDCSEEPIKITNDPKYGFGKLDSSGFLDFFRRANGISTQLNPFVLPSGFLYLGCKVIKNNQTLHFLGKDFVFEDEISLLRTFFETHENNGVKFVFLLSEPNILKGSLGIRFSKMLSIGKLPALSSSMQVSKELIYRSEFGFDFEMVKNEVGTGLIIDSKSGQIAFCGQVIWTEVETDFLKFICHLAVNKNKKVSHSVVIQDILKKSGTVSVSKIIRDQKDTFHKRVRDKFGKDSSEVLLAKKVLPELPTSDRGFSLMTSEFAEIILL